MIKKCELIRINLDMLDYINTSNESSEDKLNKITNILKRIKNDNFDEQTRWCYQCGEEKPLNEKYYPWANKEHTRFRMSCRKCMNWQSKISKMLHKKG